MFLKCILLIFFLRLKFIDLLNRNQNRNYEIVSFFFLPVEGEGSVRLPAQSAHGAPHGPDERYVCLFVIKG